VIVIMASRDASIYVDEPKYARGISMTLLLNKFAVQGANCWAKSGGLDGDSQSWLRHSARALVYRGSNLDSSLRDAEVTTGARNRRSKKSSIGSNNWLML